MIFFIMDVLSSDIIINVVSPFLPKCALVALQHTSKRYLRLVLSFFPNKSRNHLEILNELCEGGFINLLRWFLGRGKQDLHWSLLLSGLKVAIIHGKLCFIIFLHAHIFFLIQLLQLSKAVMWS